MGRVTGSWERPIQGVSQQADKDRIDGQCTLQENLIPSPLYGLIKRTGTRHVSLLMNSVSPNSLWYSYNRGDNESYIILIEPNSAPRVFDTLGVERTVNVVGGSLSYYKVANPKTDLRLSTIADYTFLLNTTTVVSSLSDLTPANPSMAIVYCQFATYARDYIIKIDGTTVASYTTPLGDDPTHADFVKTNFIASTLASKVNGVTYTEETGYTATVQGNTLFITKDAGGVFNIETIDSADGNDLVAIQDKVSQLTNLPPYAPVDYVVKVNNEEGFESTAYWLKAVADTDGDEQSGSGVRWEETLSQGITYKMNKNTLPHTLISEPDGSFTFDLGIWEDRRVGNEATNPFPSFVGGTVSSIGTFQNRMLFTSNEASVFSRTNNFFDFFRETTQTESDSDPIDAFADTSEINNLLHHAVLDGDIIFFAENGQFLIKGTSPITKSNIIFKKVTSYPLNVSAAPAVTGESVMFSFTAGKYAGIREMFTDSFTDTKRARPITEHVAEYISGKPIDLIASPNINTLFIRTDTSDSLYVYDWLWAGDQKVQSAMHTWKIGGSILFAKFISDIVFFVIERPDGVYLERMPLGNDADDNGLTFPVALDQRAVVTATWNIDRWEFTVPYSLTDTTNLRFVRGDGCWDADKGTSVIFETDGVNYWSYDDLADTTVTTTCTLTVGTTFLSRYIPTQPYLKDGNGRAMGLDRFTLGRVTINYESIGLTNITVTDTRSRRTWLYEYNGRMMGGWNNRVGFAPLDSGRFPFPVRLQSADAQIEISTEDYRPFIIRDMEWEGMFRQRGRRL